MQGKNTQARALPEHGFYISRGKRWFDLAAITLSAPIWVPLYLIVLVLVIAILGRPAHFRQVRPGLHGVPFTLYKFRSMTDARDAQGNLLPDSQRLTRFGKLLRATSLDELPELWNILRGDMSIVGPRPLLMQYLELYSAEEMRRHEVRPGLTGLAQVSGRNLLTWPEKFAADIEYVDNCRFSLDLKIIVRTVVGILTGHGISAAGEATMPVFRGTNGSAAKPTERGDD